MFGQLYVSLSVLQIVYCLFVLLNDSVGGVTGYFWNVSYND